MRAAAAIYWWSCESVVPFRDGFDWLLYLLLLLLIGKGNIGTSSMVGVDPAFIPVETKNVNSYTNI